MSDSLAALFAAEPSGVVQSSESTPMTDPLAGGIIDDHRGLSGTEAEVRAQRWLDEERRVLDLIARGDPVDRCLEELCLGAQRVQRAVRV